MARAGPRGRCWRRVWKGERCTGGRVKSEGMSPFTRASGALTGTRSVGGDFLGMCWGWRVCGKVCLTDRWLRRGRGCPCAPLIGQRPAVRPLDAAHTAACILATGPCAWGSPLAREIDGSCMGPPWSPPHPEEGLGGHVPVGVCDQEPDRLAPTSIPQPTSEAEVRPGDGQLGVSPCPPQAPSSRCPCPRRARSPGGGWGRCR